MCGKRPVLPGGAPVAWRCVTAPEPVAQQRPIDIGYTPIRDSIPVEVVQRSEVLSRIGRRELTSRQRSGFHVLMACTEGHGTHDVDFEALEVRPGTLVRIHPGQVHRFVPEPGFEAAMVLWPAVEQPRDPGSPPWYPGCGVPARWEPRPPAFTRILRSIEEIRDEQDAFDRSPRRAALMRSLLHTLSIRLSIDVPASVPDMAGLPQPYLDLRARIEQRLRERPSVAELARDLGYSTRTLDRACHQVTGSTAKQVLDERIALEIRRLLTHTEEPLAGIAADFGFSDLSNFSKYVLRHLGARPAQIRAGA